ncbi:MAG: M23 family metallopeptidase [Anaerolineaceae bacterium]|nr:M23 family metallopeptidase [Anaerolineaceae bacterium]
MGELLDNYSFKWPVKEEINILQPFGGNAKAYEIFGIKGHAGVDFNVASGTPVYPVIPGIVQACRYDSGSARGGFGHYVRLGHNGGFMSYYAHLLPDFEVQPGEVVDYETVLGYSGNSGNSAGPHLHFEIRDLSKPNNGYKGAFDPMPYFVPSIPTNSLTPPLSQSEREKAIEVFESMGYPERYGLIESEIRLRDAPSTETGAVVGDMEAGLTPAIWEIVEVGDDVWARVGVRRWAAVRHRGKQYITVRRMQEKIFGA